MTRGLLNPLLVRTGIMAAILAAGLLTGCKSLVPAPRTDQQIASDVQAKLHGESALSSQDIQVSAANGVVTLSGNVTDAASRALAGNDSGAVSGVKTVVNNLTVQPSSAGQQVAMQAASEAPQPMQATTAPAPRPAYQPEHRKPDQRKHDRDSRLRSMSASEAPPAPQPPSPMAQAVAPSQPVASPPPPEPPKPVIKQVTLPAGTVLPIRITEALDSKTSQSNDAFHGSLAADLGTQGVIAIPRGAAVVGRVVEARDAAHFKGSALLTLELTQVSARGKKLTLVTDSYTKQGEGRGKNTAEKTAGGAVLGTLIGALAGGGKGAAIGGLAGAGAGVGVNAATRGQQVTIPSETLINFHLQSPITLTVTVPPAGSEEDNTPSDPQLQVH